MGAKQHMPWFLVFMSLGVAISYCWDGSLAYGQMEELQIQNVLSLQMHSLDRVRGISMWDWCPWFALSGLVPDYTKHKAAGFILHVRDATNSMLHRCGVSHIQDLHSCDRICMICGTAFAFMMICRMLIFCRQRRLKWVSCSRMSKLRMCRTRHARSLSVRACVFACVIKSSQCMEAGNGPGAMERLTELAQSSTVTAQAAVTALRHIEENIKSRSSTTGGLESATKVLAKPPVFSGDDSYASWHHVFTSWLSYAEPQFAELLKVAERSADGLEMSDMNDVTKELSVRLHAILTSYLRGSPLQLTRLGDRNGFKVWRDLFQVFMPSTRQRSLGLAQTLATYPAFPANKPMLESIINFERIAEEYEVASGAKYPDDLMLATLIRAAPADIRKHLQLTITGHTTYRESILVYERTAQVWDPARVMQQFSGDGGGNADGPVSMEVDQIGQVQQNNKGFNKGGWSHKGKGKDKGGKGKGSSFWWSAYSGGYSGGGRGQYKGGKSKGKSKQKGKKGKSKKGSKGKGKTVDPDACRICGNKGHWGNECPNRSTNQVRQAQDTTSDAGASTSSTATGSRISSNFSPSTGLTSNAPSRTVVRQVRCFNIGTPPTTIPEYYDVGSDDETDFYGSVRMVQDGAYIGYGGADSFGFVHPGNNRASAVQSEVVVLDSGADVSLLPVRFCNGSEDVSVRTHLEDAQGGRIFTQGMRRAAVDMKAQDGSYVRLEDSFVMAEVNNILLSLGRMTKQGWWLSSETDAAGQRQMLLMPPDGGCGVCVGYKRNSLAIFGQISAVGVFPDDMLALAALRLVIGRQVRQACWHMVKSMWMAVCVGGQAGLIGRQLSEIGETMMREEMRGGWWSCLKM